MENRLNEVNVEQAQQLMKANIQYSFDAGDIPINAMLHGSPGLGKSAIVTQLAVDLGAKLVDVRLSAIESSDLMGIPYVDQSSGEMKFSTPTWFPESDEPTILFLDEIGNANVATQHAAYRLILDRTITNGKALGKKVAIVAATNLKSDKTGAKDLVPAANNRFGMHLFIKPSIDATLNYMVNKGFDRNIVGFIDYKKDVISKAPIVGEPAFATPRTWEMVNTHMKNKALSTSLLDVVIAGAVGTPVAIEFAAYREFFGMVPDWRKIRAGDESYKYSFPSNDPQLEHAVSAALAYELIDAVDNEPDSVSNLIGFMGSLGDELKIVCFKTMCRRRDLLIKGMKNKEFLSAYRDIQKYIK